MRLFSLSGASHYCASFTPRPGDAEGSLKLFFKNHFNRASITEGTPLFDDYLACSLRDVERSLFLAASHYRRCLDSMMPSASAWSYVTIYYGSWYAARAILGLFGCGIYSNHVVDVRRSMPGGQELEKRRIGTGVGQENTTYGGTHQRFWDIFYKSVAPLIPIVPAHLSVALTPVSSDHTWQITQRNEVNYDTHTSLRLSHDFQTSFSKAGFPGSLPGVLRTQYGVFEAMLELSFYFATRFNLGTDALASIGATVPFKTKIQQMVYNEKPPALLLKTKKKIILKP